MTLESITGLRTTAPSAPEAPETQNAQLLQLSELKPGTAASAALTTSRSPLLDVKAKLRVCVGEAELTVGELLGAKVDQILPLDRQVDDVVDVLLEGRVVARGRLVAVGDYFGVQLTELPLPVTV